MNLVKKIFPFITGILSGREEIFPQEELYRPIEINSDPTAFAYDEHKCVYIPKNFTLCHGMSGGYDQMWLPNFMKHEEMTEVIQQTDAWKYLKNRNCHPELQKFLCSMYAPVCLMNMSSKSHKRNTMVPPCKQLCQKVQAGCLPELEKFGYAWPDSLNCKKFPDLNVTQICVPPDNQVQPSQDKQKEPQNCQSFCLLDLEAKQDYTILKERYCSFDLVYVAKISKIQKNRGDSRSSKDLKIRFKTSKNRKSEQIFQLKNGVTMRELKRSFYLNDAGPCHAKKNCGDIDTAKKSGQKLLIMAKKVNRKLIIVHISKWPKRKSTEKIMKALFKPEECCGGKEKCGDN